MISETFGQMLKRRRKDAQLTLRALAQQVDLHFAYLSMIENDRVGPPSMRAIKRIAAAIGADTEDLVSFADIRKRYMARLDKLQEEIGELHQSIAQYRVEVAYWRERALAAEEAKQRLKEKEID